MREPSEHTREDFFQRSLAEEVLDSSIVRRSFGVHVLVQCRSGPARNVVAASARMPAAASLARAAAVVAFNVDDGDHDAGPAQVRKILRYWRFLSLGGVPSSDCARELLPVRKEPTFHFDKLGVSVFYIFVFISGSAGCQWQTSFCRTDKRACCSICCINPRHHGPHMARMAHVHACHVRTRTQSTAQLQHTHRDQLAMGGTWWVRDSIARHGRDVMRGT
jgi:hypothetical protein